MTFDFYPLRFHFVAKDGIHFPPGKAGNLLRGAFGATLKRIAPPETYRRVFEPKLSGGPSGLADPPRPFVFRIRELEGRAIAPGETFSVEVNLFDPGASESFVQAFAEWDRGDLQRVDREPEPVRLSLDPRPAPIRSVRIEFLTPTELKTNDRVADRPEFRVLFGRIRDRISTLSSLYGPGPLPIDFTGAGERSSHVTLTQCEIRPVSVARRSRHTGQTHSIGGFVGWAEYEGELAEFLPYLEAAQFTGVGRQTVWGKGEIVVAGEDLHI